MGVGTALFGGFLPAAAAERGGDLGESPAKDESLERPEEPERQPPRIRLGIERSSHASVTWLGFETPETHEVLRQSDVEQAAFAPEDAGGMAAVVPDQVGESPTSPSTPPVMIEQPPAPEPVERAAETPAPVEPPQPAEIPPPSEPTPLPPLESEPRGGADRPPAPVLTVDVAERLMTPRPAQDDATRLETLVGPVPRDESPKDDAAPSEAAPAERPVETPIPSPPLDTPAPAPETPRAAEPVERTATERQNEPQRPVEATPPVTTPAQEAAASLPTPAPGPRPAPSAGNADGPGEGSALRKGLKSDKESPAAALKRAIKHRPGRPLAAQGLEVQTVEPRWPVTVRMTSHPRNPVVVIHFDRAGKVVLAEFLRDDEKKVEYTTGEPLVDDPLLAAIYRWRAKGEELATLPNDPNATVSLVMEIILNR